MESLTMVLIFKIRRSKKKSCYAL
uniref:Uncharacterized protein n=1 Tax=Anguilla anguilla TaxID=7936 RepID=A0A0E9RT19_ANGAN